MSVLSSMKTSFLAVSQFLAQHAGHHKASSDYVLVANNTKGCIVGTVLGPDRIETVTFLRQPVAGVLPASLDVETTNRKGVVDQRATVIDGIVFAEAGAVVFERFGPANNYGFVIVDRKQLKGALHKAVSALQKKCD